MSSDSEYFSENDSSENESLEKNIETVKLPERSNPLGEVGISVDLTTLNDVVAKDNMKSYKKKEIKRSDKEYEIELIDEVLEDLERSIGRYLAEVQRLWNEIFVPFIEEEDCLTLSRMSDCETDYNKFLNYMKEQQTYILLVVSRERLHRRREYIVSEVNNKIKKQTDEFISINMLQDT